jgi:hypothetical protein
MILHVKRCDRNHPIDDLPCQMCVQEDEAQVKADDKILAALKRLKAAGKLKGVMD